MRKIKAFTLLEVLIVLVIISVVSVSLLRAKKNVSWNVDTKREVVNMIHKELDQYLKDFQRNKIREDSEWNVHEINYFRLIFSEIENASTGTQVTIWNYYSSGTDAIYFNSWTLINNQKYSAFQYIKSSERYTFYTRNKSWDAINPIRISNNWKIYTWTTNAPNENEMETQEYQFVICGWEKWIYEHIWAITINAITKESRLDRCESEKYGWIDCSIFEDC